MEDRRSLPPHEDELSLALLRSAEHDEPPRAAYSKVATALGVGAVVGLGASLPAPAALASSGLSSAAALRWSSSLLGKLVVGVSGLLLAAGGIALLRHGRADKGASLTAARAARASAALPVAEPSGDVPSPAVVSSAPVSEAAAAPAPVAALASAVSAPTPRFSIVTSAPTGASVAKSALVQGAPGAASPSALRVAKSSSLPEQVSSLDRARVALNSGDSGAALAEIAHYRSTWPRGVFLTEASVLEIEALAKRGEVALASRRAQAFVTAHPDSPQAGRLSALIPAGAQ
jgi:hypothetical protein